MRYLSRRKDVVDMFTCGTCLGGRVLLMFTCGTCLGGTMFLICLHVYFLGGRMFLICLHVVLALEEGCCCHVYMMYLSRRKDVVDYVYMWYFSWKKDIVDMFTCGTSIEGRMLTYLHAVHVLEEGCC